MTQGGREIARRNLVGDVCGITYGYVALPMVGGEQFAEVAA